MPGIVGMISQQPARRCESIVAAMVGCLDYEDFYSSGTFAAPEMGAYAGWIAHENSFAAGQPFFNEEKNVLLVLSGECFADGQAGSFGDWLVRFYEREGDQFVARLNGLFSGLLIDKRQNKVFLFNDRYGVERIYWHEKEGEFYFASEAKALLRVLPELREFDEAGVAQFLSYGCTMEGRTLFRDIRLLPGGSLWFFANGGCHKKQYFSPATWESQSPLSYGSFETAFQETFRRVLPRYFEADSRIGISLTAGLDTRLIMACRPNTEQKPVCYTFSGPRGFTLDDRLAARVAESCGLEHEVLRTGPDFFSNFAQHAERTAFVTDGCFGILGAHEIYLNKQAGQMAPVRLTGNYGGEIFRGVSTFKPIGLAPDLLDPGFRATLNSSLELSAERAEHPVTFAAFKETPWNLFGSLAACRSQTIFRTPYLDNEMVALAYRCPLNLRASPQAALRAIKDNNAGLGNIPTDMGLGGRSSGLGRALRRVYSKATFKFDYVNNEGLPQWLSSLDPFFRRVGSATGILGLHKYLHYRSWFLSELSDYLRDSLARIRDCETPFWNSAFIERMASEHIAGRKNYVTEINAVLTLEAVERLLFRNLPRQINDPEISSARVVRPVAAELS